MFLKAPVQGSQILTASLMPTTPMLTSLRYIFNVYSHTDAPEIPLLLLTECVGWCGFVLVQDLYSGLWGPLVICRPGTLKRGHGPDRRRADVEKEFALLFMVYDENQSWYMEDNIRTYLNADPDTFNPDEDFNESNLMHGERQDERRRGD